MAFVQVGKHHGDAEDTEEGMKDEGLRETGPDGGSDTGGDAVSFLQ